MVDRGLSIDHTTIYRWVQQYAPEIKKRSRGLFRPTNDSYRVDETYIKVKGQWKYLYRAVNSEGDTIDFMPSAKRDRKAAERFLKRVLKAEHAWPPRVINGDQNAAYPPAVDNLKAEGVLDESCQLRTCKYLNNIIEQDHRTVKRLSKAGIGFKFFSTGCRTINGYETMHMIRKDQVMGIAKEAIKEQGIFIKELFGIAA
jgi:transposase-like protein